MLQFWELVADKLESLKEQNWEIKKPNEIDILITTTKLLIYKQEWKGTSKFPIIGVGWERLGFNLIFGVWSNQQVKEYEGSYFRDIFKEYKEINNFKSSSNWWPIFKDGSFDFGLDEQLIEILPSNRDTLASDLASRMLNLAKDVESIVDAAIKH